MDFTDDIVLRTVLATVRRVDLVPSIYAIQVVCEFDLASNKMNESSKNCVEKLVLMRSVRYFGTIASEFNSFPTFNVKINRVEVRLW